MTGQLYFFLGIEANQRDNTYFELESALKDATWAASQMLYPIRIFQMMPHGVTQLMTVVRPEDPVVDAPVDVSER